MPYTDQISEKLEIDRQFDPDQGAYISWELKKKLRMCAKKASSGEKYDFYFCPSKEMPYTDQITEKSEIGKLVTQKTLRMWGKV